MRNNRPALTRQGNVVRLEQVRETEPHPDRVKHVRQWHIDQALCQDPPIATINVSITESGEIHAVGLAIEPEHAQIMLPELERITTMIRSHQDKCPCAHASNVRQFRLIS